HEQRRRVRLRERPVSEETHRQHRRLCAELPENEQRYEHGAGRERDDDLGASPPDAVPADEAQDDSEEARTHEPKPRQDELRARPAAFLEPPPGERNEDEPDRNVQPEDPLPRDSLDDRAADDRAERDGKAADSAPRSEREPSPVGGDGGTQKRQRERRHDR